MADFAPSYAASYRLSALALSTSASPERCIRPRSISAIALSRLILDHWLLTLRGVNRRSQNVSSNVPFCPSIQP
ncbi:hypothetical protein [Streptomyces humicola]|uniref:hypothetical protein n=1 Tax=Streptomyces humicola TaxID=2953240 RepID=UPI0027E30E35|nr:hypothetical protein [Streptomyces humicola]